MKPTIMHFTVMPDLGPQVLRITYHGQDKSIVWYSHASPNDPDPHGSPAVGIGMHTHQGGGAF